MYIERRGRGPDELRPVEFVPDYTIHAEGSCLVSFGHTRVLCTASFEERVPPFLVGTGTGWVTAEYGMLPRATHTRMQREAAKGKQKGRTVEIQRLIGRALRQAVDLEKLGERTLTIDCDVLQAGGGTRTAAITGGYVALGLALRRLCADGTLAEDPLRMPVAAISVGIVGGEARLDLEYAEDANAEVDMNVIATAERDLVEVQGTAEKGVFSRAELDTLLDLALAGIERLAAMQRKVLDEAS